MVRSKLCFGNWKLNKTPQEAQAFLADFKELCPEGALKHFCVFPTDLLGGIFSKESLSWGGQNVYFENTGAFTGESSAQTLKSMGASHCLVGHSERRSIFGETNEILNKKMKNALVQDLTPVFCIGESLEQRESGKTFSVLKEQISIGLEGVDLKKIILAYEPVWAIGTGKAATPEMVKEVHDYLRELCEEPDLPLLYGGSVKPVNAAELYEIKNVNGFLIGGASLKADSFCEIFKNMKVV